MSDRDPGDEPKSYEPTAELRPEDDVVVPLGEADELITGEGSADPAGRTASTPIVISSTPEPSKLTEERRVQARQRLEDRREESGRRKVEVPLWVWLAGGLVVLLLAIMFLASRGSDGKGATPGGAGSLEADGTDLFALAGNGGKKGAPDTETLRELEGSEVSANGAEVQSVVSDESLWVGDGPKSRFFVFFAAGGESFSDIKAGDSLSFSGELVPLPVDFKERFGLGPGGGAKQLRSQSYFIQVAEEPELE